ncbi:MAG TPA: Hsp20/alpha crystallin family protein [Candidatus Paceibacterota bacterium]|nr:Hsp20/alpha crystallin family protein [Candidatus Paceibacterota bacterium]
MARDKKSLFDWLTGGSGADNEYSFDDLDSGSSLAVTRSQAPKKSLPITRVAEEEPAELPEETMEGELSIDMHQTPTHIVIKAMIAGVRPEDLDISITRDMVTIRGKRERATEGHAGDYFFQELYWGTFSRTIVLPQEVEIEEAEAVEKHGLLVIRLPKMDKGRQAKLKVRSN